MSFDPYALTRPRPFSDNEDLAAVLALPELELIEGEEEFLNPLSDQVRSLDFISRHLLAVRRDYRRWLAEAKTLAALGVIPGPSHSTDLLNDSPLPRRSAWIDLLPHYRSDDLKLLYGFALGPGGDASRYGQLPAGYPWRAFELQTAGVACHHPRIIGFELKIRPKHLDGLRTLTTLPSVEVFHPKTKEHGTGHVCIGATGPATLSELARYHELLDAQKLSAEYCYSQLEEGIYPISRQHASRLSLTPVPSDDELWPYPDDGSVVERFGYLSGLIEATEHLALFVIGPNCD